MPPNRSTTTHAPVRREIVSSRSDRGGTGGDARPETEVVVMSSDGAVSAVPVLLAQLSLEDLAGAGHGQGVDDLHAPRRLVARDQRLDVLAQLVDAQLRARVEHEHGVHALTPGVVRYTDDRAGRDSRV